MNAPAVKLDRLRADIVDLVRQRDLVRSHGYATRKLDNIIASKQRTLELLTEVAADLHRVRRRSS